MSKVAGIDYSMTCPAITVMDLTKSKKFDDCVVHYLNESKRFAGVRNNIHGTQYSKPTNNIQRFEQISEWAYSVVFDCKYVMLEGYSMGSRGHVFDIAENTALLKYKLYRNSIPIHICPPTVLKKFATGKGNADKNRMYTSFVERTGINLKKLFNSKGEKIGSPLSDIVDSYYLALYGSEVR